MMKILTEKGVLFAKELINVALEDFETGIPSWELYEPRR
jgi:hypothetical protein